MQSILSLVEAVEAGNTLHAPTEHLEAVAGTWRLLFSTISILVRCRSRWLIMQCFVQQCHALQFMWSSRSVCFRQGRRRVKLGLRSIVNVGELTQHVDVQRQHSVSRNHAVVNMITMRRLVTLLPAHVTVYMSVQVNVVNFDILVFGKFKGSLTLEASYTVVGPQRVAITLEKATLLPSQFSNCLRRTTTCCCPYSTLKGFWTSHT